MTTKYFAILTNQGAARLANATALGTKLNISQMAVGDGGGTLPTPDPAQTKLINQTRIAPINSLGVDANDAGQIIAEQIIPENEGGFFIREIGLYDDDGILIAVANCPETYKPLLAEGSGRTQTIRMILVVSSTSAITLKIDPSVVLATRKYVDDAVIEVKGYADKLMKDHEAKANPHKQYPLIENALKEMADAGLADKVLENLGLVDAAGFTGRLTGKPQIITSSKMYSPTPGCKFAIAEIVGAGGGGGGCWLADTTGASAGGGGGSGGYSVVFIANPVATAVTIGLGGSQGLVSLNTTPPDGSPGGDSSFGVLATAKGGFGGLSTAWAVATGTSDTACTDGGGGALAGTGDIALPGNAGFRGQQLSRNGSAGNGAPSRYGSGGSRSRGVAGALIPPVFGGGGLGNYRANNTTTPGTDGANGLCVVWEYL